MLYCFFEEGTLITPTCVQLKPTTKLAYFQRRIAPRPVTPTSKEAEEITDHSLSDSGLIELSFSELDVIRDHNVEDAAESPKTEDGPRRALQSADESAGSLLIG
jgi:hypothetical protein